MYEDLDELGFWMIFGLFLNDFRHTEIKSIHGPHSHLVSVIISPFQTLLLASLSTEKDMVVFQE
jgi:hypothetical protein